MKHRNLYPLLIIMAVLLAAGSTTGCIKITPPGGQEGAPAAVSEPGSAGQTAQEGTAGTGTATTTPTPTVTPGTDIELTGAPDLVITDLWLEGCMIYYKIKNTGTADAPGTTSYLYVDNMFPPMGSTSFCDVMKPGQERTLAFSSYQWPDCGQQPSGTSGASPLTGVFTHVTTGTGDVAGYMDYSLLNHAVKVCADGKNEAREGNKNNNCMTKVWGILLDYDLLPVAHMATWKNSAGEMPSFGAEGSTAGAYIKMSDGGLEMVPEQVPQGWIQGYWGVFSTDRETRAAQTAAIKLPAQTHLKLRVGLASHAQGSDGVTFRVGLRDVTDTLNFLQSKKMTVPGQFEDWDIDLSDYEGQKVLIVLRVEAGASPTNDFAVWNQARLMQINP